MQPDHSTQAGTKSTAPLAPGASAAEWKHWQSVGLQADLLPVVSDLTVPRGQTTIKNIDGKTPMIIKDGRAIGVPGWSTRTTTAAEVARWSKDDRHGIGVIGRQVKAFDVDIDDETVAGAVRDMLELGLGALPCRGRPGTGKKLLMFRLAEPMPKVVVKTAHGIIEMLGDRQQFLLIGRHKSGTRYAWEGGLPAVIPTLTREEVDNAVQALAQTFGTGETTADREAYVMRPAVECDGEDKQRDRVAKLWPVADEDIKGRLHGQCPWWTEHTDPDPDELAGMYIPAAVKDQGHSGYRCLHAHCANRKIFEFLAKIGVTAEETVEAFEVMPALEAELAVSRNKAGRILPERNNLVAVLDRPDLTGFRLRHDTFTDEVMLRDESSKVWRQFRDVHYSRLAQTLERGGAGFAPIPIALLKEVVAERADRHHADSAQDWLGGLTWDGTPRIDRFLSDYLGVADGPYARAVSRYLWTALPGRVMGPGVQADMAPVLVGPQGTGKSTIVKKLVPHRDYFLELDLSKKDEDLAREMRGKLVIELGEMKGMRAREISALKSFVARDTDEWVAKFKEYSTRYQRRSVLIGTSNEKGCLPEDTEHRRWLPVDVPRRTPEARNAAVNALVAVRDQLWAEGAAVFAASGIQWADAERLAKSEHGAFESRDVWLDPIRDWLNDTNADNVPRKARMVKVTGVLAGALNKQMGAVTMLDQKRVAAVLRKLGFREDKRTVDGKRVPGWWLDGEMDA